MKCEIITVGTELLYGEIVNTNASYLAKRLKRIGVDVSRQTSIADDVTRLKNCLRAALERSDLVITTGGLGGTEDDVTREAVSELLGLPLTRDEEQLASIREYFAAKGDEMPDGAAKEADVISGAKVLSNSVGLAPGQYVPVGDKAILLLPGPPAELRDVFENGAERIIGGSGAHIVTETVNVFGILESAMSDIIKGVDCGNATVGTYARNGELSAEITVNAASKNEAEAEAKAVADRIEEAIGEFAYGRNAASLAEEVVRLLSEKKLRVTTAESCTGGLLAKRITDINGASAVFEQGVTAYSNEIKRSALSVRGKTLKKFGAVSPQAAADMAAGALFTSKADYALSITGYAGDNDPKKGKVFICLYDGRDCHIRQLSLTDPRYTRSRIREIAALHALDMLRRCLCGLPVVTERWLAEGDSVMPDIKIGPFYVKQKDNGKDAKKGFFPRRYKFDPRRGNFSWLNVVRVVAFCMAFVVLVVSSAYILNDYMERRRNIKASEKAQEMFNDPEQYIENNDPDFIYIGPEDILDNFRVLYMQNSDIVGWISLKKNNGQAFIDYPVVQSTDNDHYLRRSFFGDYATGGTIFMDYRCNATVFSKNTVLYGHNMKDNSMFAQLLKYGNASFYNAAPIIDYSTLYKECKFKIFAAFYTTTDFNYIQVSFADRKEFLAIIAEAKARSSINTNVDVTVDDTIITLSTCAYIDGIEDARFVVMGRLLRDGESAGGCWASDNPDALDIRAEYVPSGV
ncbi:MAG: competence/damage-inducible protein A [Clostridia bacterium]|nr:competence/damage-inducible protein A [Clostridia bacterium]